MAVTADKKIDGIVGMLLLGFQTFAEPGNEPGVVFAGIAANMRHKDVYLFYSETVELRKGVAHISGIHVSVHRARGFELPQSL